MSGEYDHFGLQQKIKEIFGDNAGEFYRPAGAGYGEVQTPYLDKCTDTKHPVPDFVGEDRPTGTVYTELCITQLIDGTGRAYIAERSSGYRPGRKRKHKPEMDNRGVALKRLEHMDPDTRKRSAARAGRKLKDHCAQLGVDRIGTGTFRDNVTDRTLAVKIHEDFIRLYKQELPYTFYINHMEFTVTDFQYVAVFESQKRGALHEHFGLNHPHCIDRLRRCWQQAQKNAGLENPDGNFNIRYKPGRKKFRASQKIAGYFVHNYLKKDFESGEMYKKRYLHSKGIPEPSTTRLYYLTAYSTEELIEALESMLGVRVTSSWWHKIGPHDLYNIKFEPG